MLEIVVSIDSAVEISITGILKAVKSRLVRQRIAGSLKRQVTKLLSEGPYRELVAGRARGHVFVELEDVYRSIEPALFPANESWCQLCAVSEVTAEFLALSAPVQVERICTRVRESLDRYLVAKGADRGGRARASSKKSTSLSSYAWTAVFPCDAGLGSDADVRLRHDMESALEGFLQAEGLGEVEGGSIGSGSMEVHFSTRSRKSTSQIEKSVRAFLARAGFPVPSEMLPETDS